MVVLMLWRQNCKHPPASVEVLTSLNVDLITGILFAGEHTNYDSIVTILDELLHLFRSLDLFGGRSCLLSHVFNDAYREHERTEQK